MKLWQAKAHAKRAFPDLELHFRRDYRGPGGTCAVLLADGTPIGMGRSWLQALRDMALRLERIAATEKKQQDSIVTLEEPP